ncbi:MAG: pyridoxal-phosphate dependent enzyme [Gammaproteobacteria bacterium]|nr:pyridoxal-phosphate dependent enzyme [Gammaproteobacteria bacterium]
MSKHKMPAIYNTYSESILLPRLIRMSDNLILAKFELMKIVPAKYIIEAALRSGKINPEIPIIETSSGTFALGMAIACAELKLPFYVISDPVIEPPLEQQLIQLGGKVQILSHALQAHNPQEIRLNALQEYLQAHPETFWTQQYDNPDNPNSYSSFANFLAENLGTQLTLVGAVGSGGSTCGTIKALRKFNAGIRLAGVDTFGSVLFGLPNQKRILRGLGNSLMPKNLDHSAFDEVHWVNANDAFQHTRKLFSEKGLFCGPTTGAAYQVANWIAKKNPHELVVCIAPDTGYRYQDTVYNDSWLAKNQLCSPITIHPAEVSHPSEANPNLGWSYLKWQRRSYQAMLGQIYDAK